MGGTTSADELRRIADVVDRYRIPTVKITGGQRIDLLRVQKQDLPAVWRDLDMPSGHAYAKALRTVKTCVRSEWCRFGVQDSSTLGIDLERTLWPMVAPHKVKLAVSGCPRKGGPLSQGIVCGHAVTCPLHGRVIPLDSGDARAPDVGHAIRHAVKVDAGRVCADRRSAGRRRRAVACQREIARAGAPSSGGCPESLRCRVLGFLRQPNLRRGTRRDAA